MLCQGIVRSVDIFHSNKGDWCLEIVFILGRELPLSTVVCFPSRSHGKSMILPRCGMLPRRWLHITLGSIQSSSRSLQLVGWGRRNL